MLKRDEEGRRVDPFQLFEAAARRAIRDMGSYWDAICQSVHVRTHLVDATALRRQVRSRVEAVITSPPYHCAVDYYRRHKLEMFWLDLTADQNDRLRLLDHYIGRPAVAARHPYVAFETLTTPKVKRLEARMRSIQPKRADALKHYCISMRRVLDELSRLLRPGAPAVLVVGHSSWNGNALNTSELFEELSAPAFHLVEHLWYPVRNRYMSYSRHNGASIEREYVLVLRRTTSEPLLESSIAR